MKKIFLFLLLPIIGASVYGAGINFPLGAADVQTQPGTTGALAYTLTNSFSYINLIGLTGTVTVNLTLDPKLPTGSRLFIRAVQGGTPQNVVLGTGFAAGLLAAIQTLAGVAANANVIEAVYDGTVYQPINAWQRTI